MGVFLVISSAFVDFNSYLCALNVVIMKRIFGMKRLFGILSLILSAVMVLSACGSEDKTYGEQKEEERKVVKSFINRDVVMKMGQDTLLDLGRIKVITESQFESQDSTTNLDNNEFVLFANTGVYMQIVREGTGKRIGKGENRQLICRFWEYNIMGDSLQLTNRIPSYATRPEYLNISNNSGYISGSFDLNVPTGSLMNSTYGDTNVPDGWLKALEYVRVGAQTDEKRIAKVRLIVPHSAGHSHAISGVYPCFYELTFREL